MVLILNTRETVGRIFDCLLSGRLHPHFPLWALDLSPPVVPCGRRAGAPRTPQNIGDETS